MAVRQSARSVTSDEKEGRVSGSRDQHWFISVCLGREKGRMWREGEGEGVTQSRYSEWLVAPTCSLKV